MPCKASLFPPCQTVQRYQVSFRYPSGIRQVSSRYPSYFCNWPQNVDKILLQNVDIFTVVTSSKANRSQQECDAFNEKCWLFRFTPGTAILTLQAGGEANFALEHQNLVKLVCYCWLCKQVVRQTETNWNWCWDKLATKRVERCQTDSVTMGSPKLLCFRTPELSQASL